MSRRPARNGKSIRKQKPPNDCRLLLEALESRLAPATITGGSELLGAYGQLPLSFEANQGQTSAQVDFLSRGNGYALFLTPLKPCLRSISQSAARPRPKRQQKMCCP
jgi:Planctomycete extracellular